MRGAIAQWRGQRKVCVAGGEYIDKGNPPYVGMGVTRKYSVPCRLIVNEFPLICLWEEVSVLLESIS